MIHEMAAWLVERIFEYGYFGIFALMAIESSFIPFPSEIVLIPAGYLASKAQMSASLILLSSIAGSLVGSLVNYYLAYFVGRKFLLRYGRYILINKETLTKMERFFQAHGAISTFSGRLIPGIRQLISIPAGLAKMDIKIFLFYTSLGAAIWSLILIAFGYLIGENEALIKEYLPQITAITLMSIAVIIIIYIYRHKKINNT
ncbi:MAG: DedA family protein [Campylobacterota bacterium]|nr:DedA family protein [Campylobacterota bacterium]